MGEEPEQMAESATAIAERRQRVHHQTSRRRWRRGPIGTSEEARRRLARSWTSRALHRVGELTSHAAAGLIVVVIVLGWLIFGWLQSFPTWWEVALYSTSSSSTLVMVFAIQHTQARQQAAVQRKLDEILRAITTADDRLIAVEEAPDEELQALADLNIEDRERSAP